MVLAAVAALLAVLLFWLRGGLHPAAPLERLARQSPDLTTALTNGRPTLVEFYADWCEACRTMAPAMETIEQKRRGTLDVVLLNVDNPRWQPELERYAVNGIPQLELFDAGGHSVGRSIGARRPEELEALTTALVEARPLPQLVGVGATSSLEEVPGASAAPGGGSAGSGGPSGAADRPAASGASSLEGTSATGSVIAESPPSAQPGRRAAIGPRSHG
jgi:thiol-disulfide isomerase/thioredoxin